MKRLLAKLVSTISEQTEILRMHICTRGYSRHCPENHPTSYKLTLSTDEYFKQQLNLNKLSTPLQH